jgi:ABC-type nitrate/sulfonate/bicarbonate transport system ATPase subunit
VSEPDILLMDEAFGSLDAITRQKLYREFVAILEKRPMTVVLVTHDVTEAVMLSARVLRLAEGGVRNRWDIDLPYPRNLAMPQVGVLSEKILSEFFA